MHYPSTGKQAGSIKESVLTCSVLKQSCDNSNAATIQGELGKSKQSYQFFVDPTIKFVFIMIMIIFPLVSSNLPFYLTSELAGGFYLDQQLYRL